MPIKISPDILSHGIVTKKPSQDQIPKTTPTLRVIDIAHISMVRHNAIYISFFVGENDRT